MTKWTYIDNILTEIENKESELFERNLSSCDEMENEKQQKR